MDFCWLALSKMNSTPMFHRSWYLNFRS